MPLFLKIFLSLFNLSISKELLVILSISSEKLKTLLIPKLSILGLISFLLDDKKLFRNEESYNFFVKLFLFIVKKACII